MELVKHYALFLESKPFISDARDTVINEAAAPDMQTADGLKKVLSGESPGSPYQPQWDSLIDQMTANLKKDGTYVAHIIHDNGKPMVDIEYKIVSGKPEEKSIKLAAGVATSTVKGSSLDLNKIAEYNPNGKMYEFVAALITISIDKFGKAWTKTHIDWVNSQINKCKALGGFYANITKPASSSFLQGDGNIAGSWIKLTGGDLINQVTVITNKYKIAGSVESEADVRLIMDAIDLKLNETVTSFADSAAIHGLYMLISPKFTVSQLKSLWESSGKSGSLLAGLLGEIDEIANLSGAWEKKFICWCVGLRGAAYWDGLYSAYGFDKSAYASSLTAIKSALV